MKITREEHAAQVQFFRWLQLYEREMSPIRIQHQLEILAEDVFIQSMVGEMKGREHYPELIKVYAGWQNAHHVQNVTVYETMEGEMNLEADVVYQSIQPDVSQKTYPIHYSTLLEWDEGERLPLFCNINMAITGEAPAVPLSDAYPKNRLRALMHYWLFLLEQLEEDVAPFRELLAEEFVLDLSEQSHLTSIDDLASWLQRVSPQLESSNHYPRNFSVKTLGEHAYEMRVVFAWSGLSEDGQELAATTAHTWEIVDDVTARFPRIRRMSVKALRDFGPVD